MNAALQHTPAIDENATIMIMARLRRVACPSVAPYDAAQLRRRERRVIALADLSETQSKRWQRLMIAAQAADPRAYAEFLQAVTPFIRVIARRYHRDGGTVEDIVQESLVSIHRMRSTYEPGRAVEPWIAAIAKARAIDALRARTRRQRLEAPASDDIIANIPDTQRSASDARDAQATVAEAMAALPPAQRAAVRLLKIEELSLKEASDASGLSVPALKSSLHRAMLALRTALTGNRDA